MAESRIREADVVALLAWSYIEQHAPPGGEEFDPHYGGSAARGALDAYVGRALGDDAVSVAREVVCDLPARALLEAGQRADLLVVGARGLGGFRGLLLGSVSQRCVHLATRPLVIVRADVGGRGRGRVVVGVDGTDASRAALRWAMEESRLRATALVVVHAWHEQMVGFESTGLAVDPTTWESSARALLDRMLGEVGGAEARGVQRSVVHSGAAEALVEASKTAELVVVGNRGHGAFSRLVVGSVAGQVAQHARCAVALIPAA